MHDNKYGGDREHEKQQGPGVTIGLGGRGALRRSSLRLRIQNKQKQKITIFVG